MSELQIAWLELIMVGGLGIILALSGIIINVAVKKRNRLCTKQTEGSVVRYRFAGEGNMCPIVEYSVAGICYKAKKKFRGVKTKKISGLFALQVHPKAYEDERGWLHVEVGAIANMRKLAEQLWPIGSKMTVYYNPNNPKKCYVDRPILNSFTTMMFIIMGMVIVFLSVLVFFLMQL